MLLTGATEGRRSRDWDLDASGIRIRTDPDLAQAWRALDPRQVEESHPLFQVAQVPRHVLHLQRYIDLDVDVQQ